MSHLSNPIFHDQNKARKWLETQMWPDGPVCPHCGEQDNKKLEGKAHRPGLYQCNDCRQQFTVTVGTLFERSKIPLNKWLMATFLLVASKKGMSAHQLHRMLGISYKSTWYMMHRIREALREGKLPPMGSDGGNVQADETYIGRKYHRKGDYTKRTADAKEKVVSLIDDGGKVRSFHVPEVNVKTLRPILFSQIDRAAGLYTDESRVYTGMGREFKGGRYTVNHSIKEYVRGGATTNACENYFSILKRGLGGVYQHCSAKHLKRYVGEFDFRYNNRDVVDIDRFVHAARGIKGKRLTYRRTGEGRASA